MPKSQSKMWRLLNSPFVIWCLSSVVVGILTASFHSFQRRNLENKQCAEKRAALAQEISIRALDFAVKCQSSKSYDELWWHRDEFEAPQNHLAQFREMSMDELTFQFGLLPGHQDRVARESLDKADDEIYKSLVKWSNGSAYDGYMNEFAAFKTKIKQIICSEIIALRQDVESKGESPSPNAESSDCPLE